MGPNDFDSRPYWKPRDLAALLDVSPSHIYRLIEEGDLEHRRVGKRAVRIPGRAVAKMLGAEAPVTSPVEDDGRADLAARANRFAKRTGQRPEAFAAAWREGRIEDTPDNAREAIEALALREALSVPVYDRA